MPIAVEEAFHGTLPVPLPDICGHWYGPIPPIKEVRDQTGDWGAVGESRTLLMVGGGSVHEELTTVEPPRLFGYRLTDIKGPMSVLVGSVTGAWIFVPMDGGTQITWRWTIHPKSALTAPALPAFGMLWKGYARRVLQKLSTILTG
ncbi:Polyketide cyclase / dehydrase and lipid transport [Mycobacterium basiliense]|uniref:Polyketide cyclase / dehydrase and lipid transport n=1 Tax=Mycobacterium basiliense TaxID=2094119 RepID=A0A3S4BYS6_9MYCO|nr:Polyketide cyclase / dehydrase and lipid transport [Mycobacterium basiliense]